MLSTFGLLPSTRQTISTLPIPIIITVQPLTKTATIFPPKYRHPRCTRCGSYLSPNCAQSTAEWCCALCSNIMKKPSARIPPQTTPVAEISETPELLPLRHSLIIFTGIDKSTISEYLAALPPRAPVRLITSPDPNQNVPDGMASQIVKELDSITFSRVPVPFDVASQAIIDLLGEYDTQGNLEGPWWCRIFIQTPPLDSVTSPLLNFIQKQRSGHVRVDFYFIGNYESPLLASLVHDSPGISRVFQPMCEGDLLTALLPDAKREFAFQVQGRFRSGTSYSARFLPSVYLTSWENKDVLTIPVLPADTASLSFEITPPEVDEGLRYQGLQFVVKFMKWNPITNRVSQRVRIISGDFKVTSSLPALIDSISPVFLFHSWVRAAQNLSSREMQSVIQPKLQAIAPIVLEHKSLHPIIRMTWLVKSHPVMGPTFQERLTMGSLLSLSPPTAIAAQFFYNVEVWSDCNTLVESGFRVDPNRRRPNYIYLIKSFPNLFIASKGGRVAVAAESEMEKSIRHFGDECQPLAIRILHTRVDRVGELLAVDDEEDLPDFLKETGLEEIPPEAI